MGTYVALAFLLFVTAVLSRSDAQPQSPSLAEFAAFCNEIAGSGGAPSPLIEVLCRQVAERAAPPSDTASWSGVESLSVPEEAATASTDQGTTLQAQQAEQVTVKPEVDSGVVIQETNDTSESQSRDSGTLNVDNAVPGTDNETDTFRVLEGQSVSILNSTDPEVIGGTDFNSNVAEAVATTADKSNSSVLQPENKIVHLQPHNVSTFYMGKRAQSKLLGSGRNVPPGFQRPTTNVNTLKRGDQMPVPENQSSDSLAVRESSRNPTFNHAETLEQLPEVVPQKSQSGIYNSNYTLNVDQSSDIFRIPETEQKKALADRTNATEDSINEGQVDVEQVSTTVTTESEAPTATEVARDSLYTTSGSDMTAGEMQDAGFGSAGNGSSAQPGIQVADGPNSIDGFSDVQSSISKTIHNQEHDTTPSTTEGTSEKVDTETSLGGRSPTFPTLGNQQSLTSEQGATGGQSTPDQTVEGIPQESVVVETKVDQGERNYTPKIESAVDLKGSNENSTESTTLITERTIVGTENLTLTNGEDSKGLLPDKLGQNLGNYNPNGGISTSNMASEQDVLSNPKNGMGVGQQTLITKPAENSDNPENPPSKSVSVDLPPQALPGNTEGLYSAGSANQQTNQAASLPRDGNSPTGTTMTTSVNAVNSTALPPNPSASTGQLPFGVSSSEGNSSASASHPPNASGSANQPSVGESSSEGNPVASTSLPPNLSGSANQKSVGVSPSEGRSVASSSLPPTPSGSANQPSVGVSSSEGNPVASTSLPPNPAGSTSEPSAGMSSSEGNAVASTSLPPNPSGFANQPSVGVSSSERNPVASTSLPPNPAGSANQPSVGVSSTEGNSVASPSLPSNPSGSTGQPAGGVSSSEVSSAATTPLPPTSEGDYITDSMLLLKELSTKFLESLADIHCRQSVNDFWKKVTEVIWRLSIFHKATVRDMTSGVTEVIESYRRESPYWTTIAAKLEQATSDGRWRQMVGAVAGRRRGDPASQLRLLRASRQLREAVRAAVSAPECRSAGAQPAAERCQRFLLCYRAGWQWRAVSLSCPAGSAFSRTERRCVWRPLAGCTPAPSFTGWVDDDGDSDSDYDSDSDTSEERSWSRLGHAHSLFRMFDFRH